MQNIRFYTIENELYFKGKKVLRYTIEYPEVIKINNDKRNTTNRTNTTNITNEELNSINENIRKDILNIKDLIENKIYKKICNEIENKTNDKFIYLKNVKDRDTYNIYCICKLLKEKNRYKPIIDMEVKIN